MVARDFGFLACRFLSVLFFTYGLITSQTAVTAQATYGQTEGAFGALMRDRFGHVWVIFLTAILLLSAACFLWYRADWLSRLFVLNPSAEAPDFSRREVVSTGLGLIGVYVLLRAIPDGMGRIADVFDPYRPTPLGAHDYIIIASPVLMIAISLVLILKNLRRTDIFNYSFRDDQ